MRFYGDFRIIIVFKIYVTLQLLVVIVIITHLSSLLLLLCNLNNIKSLYFPLSFAYSWTEHTLACRHWGQKL